MSQIPTQELWPDPMDARRRRYASKTSAARKLQAMYRRYRGRSSGSSTTPATRTLSRAVREYRYANPMYIQPSNARTATFWRTTRYNVQLNESTGFNNGAGASYGFNLNFGFSLGNVIAFYPTSAVVANPVANAAEFQALFDTYTIKNVRMKMFFTNNNSSVNSPATGMPMFHICNDFDDISEPMTVNSILEKAGVRTVQFDAMNHQGLHHWVKPAAKQVVAQTDPTTGTQTTSNAGVPFGTYWIDTAVSNIVYNGIKLFYDNQGRSSNTDIGSATFIFEVEYVFKGYR